MDRAGRRRDVADGAAGLKTGGLGALTGESVRASADVSSCRPPSSAGRINSGRCAPMSASLKPCLGAGCSGPLARALDTGLALAPRSRSGLAVLGAGPRPAGRVDPTSVGVAVVGERDARMTGSVAGLGGVDRSRQVQPRCAPGHGPVAATGRPCGPLGAGCCPARRRRGAAGRRAGSRRCAAGCTANWPELVECKVRSGRLMTTSSMRSSLGSLSGSLDTFQVLARWNATPLASRTWRSRSFETSTLRTLLSARWSRSSRRLQWVNGHAHPLGTSPGRLDDEALVVSHYPAGTATRVPEGSMRLSPSR